MKRFLLIFLCISVALLMLSSVVLGAGPGTGIRNTKHDLSSTGDTEGDYGIDGQDRICIWCHAPHHTLKIADAAGINYLPLWNHEVTTQTYILYSNGPDDPNDLAHRSMAEVLSGQPGGVSRLCLSCHDGSVAVNEYGFAPSQSLGLAYNSNNEFFIAADTRFRIGGATSNDLSNHHPIGFDYQSVQATDDEIAPVTDPMGTTGNTIGDLLWAGKMECTTCHDVHNTKNQGEKFLWISNTNSNFCLTCHLKGSLF